MTPRADCSADRKQRDRMSSTCVVSVAVSQERREEARRDKCVVMKEIELFYFSGTRSTSYVVLVHCRVDTSEAKNEGRGSTVGCWFGTMPFPRASTTYVVVVELKRRLKSQEPPVARTSYLYVYYSTTVERSGLSRDAPAICTYALASLTKKPASPSYFLNILHMEPIQHVLPQCSVNRLCCCRRVVQPANSVLYIYVAVRSQ